jgi:hypothetical protein
MKDNIDLLNQLIADGKIDPSDFHSINLDLTEIWFRGIFSVSRLGRYGSYWNFRYDSFRKEHIANSDRITIILSL